MTSCTTVPAESVVPRVVIVPPGGEEVDLALLDARLQDARHDTGAAVCPETSPETAWL